MRRVLIFLLFLGAFSAFTSCSDEDSPISAKDTKDNEEIIEDVANGVSGKITDNLLRGIEGVSIIMKSDSIVSESFSGVTDEDGEYSFVLSVGGRYTIIATKNGFTSDTSHVVVKLSPSTFIVTSIELIYEGATGTITGRLKNSETMDRLIGYKVYLGDKVFYTDKYAKFTMTDLIPGKYELLFQNMRYLDYSLKNIEVIGDSISNVGTVTIDPDLTGKNLPLILNVSAQKGAYRFVGVLTGTGIDAENPTTFEFDTPNWSGQSEVYEDSIFVPKIGADFIFTINVYAGEHIVAKHAKGFTMLDTLLEMDIRSFSNALPSIIDTTYDELKGPKHTFSATAEDYLGGNIISYSYDFGSDGIIDIERVVNEPIVTIEEEYTFTQYGDTDYTLSVMDDDSNVVTIKKSFEVINMILHVSPDGDDENKGESWDDALQSPSLAISKAYYGKSVWVKQGVYELEDGVYFNNSSSDTVYVYGGFNGTEKDPSERSLQTFTTLSAENATGITTVLSIGYTTQVDGFIITGARGSSEGGGVLNKGVIKNCIVKNNTAHKGGGIFNWGVVDRCVVYGNTAGVEDGTYKGGYEPQGGGIYNRGGIIRNSIVRKNTCYGDGGGINCWGGTVQKTIVDSNRIAASFATGGGVHSWGVNSDKCIIRANIMEESFAGAAYHNWGDTLSNTYITGNIALRGNPAGLDITSGIAVNCIVTYNVSSRSDTPGIDGDSDESINNFEYGNVDSVDDLVISEDFTYGGNVMDGELIGCNLGSFTKETLPILVDKVDY